MADICGPGLCRCNDKGKGGVDEDDTAVHVPNITGPLANLCWQQSPTMVRCDRKKRHAGLHSWEITTEFDALRARLATAEAELARLNGMQCCGCQRWDVRGAAVMGRCGKWSIQTPALHGCFAWEKRDAE